MRLAVNNAAAPDRADQHRALVIRCQIARKALGLEEDDYRAALERIAGHRSARDCSIAGLRAAIAHFESQGAAAPAAPRRRDLGEGLTVRKARAMWISLYQLGAIEDGSDAALESFGKRQLGVDRLRWANEREGFRLIEALKAIATRAGWDQRTPSRMAGSERIHLLKDRLVGAQIARLAAAGEAVTGPLAADRSSWSGKQLENAAAELAARVRALPRAGSAAADGGQA